MELSGKKIIVTGGLNGIGRVLVDKLCEKGATVGVFDIEVESNSSNTTQKGPCFFKCDVSNHTQVESAVNDFYKAHDRIDVLVNNAGILFSAPLVSFSSEGVSKHDVDSWKKVIDTDLNSVFYMTVNVAEKMISNRTKGVIVNISSVSAGGNAGQSAYSAAKAGINALTKTWAKELGLFNIRVLAVAPGFTNTTSTHNALSEGMLKDITKKVPLRRLGKPEEIVDSILWSIRNDFITGKIIEVDGGLVI
jgi:3-oxoacyl-[acyl-carrier protein] reductase